MPGNAKESAGRDDPVRNRLVRRNDDVIRPMGSGLLSCHRS